MYSKNRERVTAPKTKRMETMIMTNILINRYEDKERFPGAVECVEMTLDRATKHNVASLDFALIQKAKSASVFGAHGTITGIAELAKAFIEAEDVAYIINQVHRDCELKAMYRAGFRFGSNPELNLAKTLELLKERNSISMVWVKQGR